MKKQNILANGFIVFAVIIFFLTWLFGVEKLAIYILVLVGICAYGFIVLISLFIKDFLQTTVVYAILIYLGISFISLSKFKTDIASWDVDINMIGVGLALVALAIALNVQRKEQKPDDRSPMQDSTLEVSDETEETIEEQELPSIDIVLDEVRRKQDFQFKQLDGFATKAGTVLGIAGVIFTLLVTNLLGESSTTTNLTLAKIALIPILASLVLSFIPIYIIKWDRPPNLDRLRDKYIVKDEENTKLNIIDKCLVAVDNNQRQIDKIIYLIKGSYVLLFLGLVLLAVWVGMIIW